MFLALIVAWILFTILVKIVKTTVKTAFFVAAIVVLLQVAYNISPQDVLDYIIHLPETLNKLRSTK
ncbi:MAG: hypothetical protein KME60_02055 [Cyanomargarita calcarea GSE-NOS-MK-12-04C]|jgi:hypothetical protein|uniref:Uncharacterized protein n=1 Tax=Cyanomargarita calcarea GSE-NOS-MK-12-04C TaxID=2839659 RepID=A0A951UQR2_9CYAN|nr:hypothetical protein [Cyanomargarita calcarea GSE-NOS-MK-12-04C]